MREVPLKGEGVVWQTVYFIVSVGASFCAVFHLERRRSRKVSDEDILRSRNSCMEDITRSRKSSVEDINRSRKSSVEDINRSRKSSVEDINTIQA